jgi:FtsH-binding integral membrane protein
MDNNNQGFDRNNQNYNEYQNGNQTTYQNNYQNTYQDVNNNSSQNGNDGVRNWYNTNYTGNVNGNAYQYNQGMQGGEFTAYQTEDVEAKVQNVLAKTFAFMFGVLLITAVSAYITANTDALVYLLNTKIMYGLIAAEIVVLLFGNYVMSKNKEALSAITLIVYSVINGVTLSVIFLAYDLGSIVTVFVMASAIFASMAVFGLVTKRDLSAIGTVGIMLLVGIIMLSLANLFIHSSGLSLAISAVGLAVFIGLTAFDMQRIKTLARESSNNSTTTLAMFGALMLYLDFINIFLKLLRLFARSND